MIEWLIKFIIGTCYYIIHLLGVLTCRLLFQECRKTKVEIYYFELDRDEYHVDWHGTEHFKAGKYKRITKICPLCGKEESRVEEVE